MDKIAAEAARAYCEAFARDSAAFHEVGKHVKTLKASVLAEYIERALSQSLAARDKEIEEHREALQAVLDYYEDKEPKDEHSNCREHVCAIAAARALLKGKAI